MFFKSNYLWLTFDKPAFDFMSRSWFLLMCTYMWVSFVVKLNLSSSQNDNIALCVKEENPWNTDFCFNSDFSEMLNYHDLWNFKKWVVDKWNKKEKNLISILYWMVECTNDRSIFSCLWNFGNIDWFITVILLHSFFLR